MNRVITGRLLLLSVAAGIAAICWPAAASGQGTGLKDVGASDLGGKQFHGYIPTNSLGGAYTRESRGVPARYSGFSTGLPDTGFSSAPRTVGGVGTYFRLRGRSAGTLIQDRSRFRGGGTYGFAPDSFGSAAYGPRYAGGGAGEATVDLAQLSGQMRSLLAAQGLAPVTVPTQSAFDLPARLKASPDLRRAADDIAAGRFAQANSEITLALALDRQQAEAEWLAAVAQAGAGDAVDAVRHLRNALDCYPDLLTRPRGAAVLLGARLAGDLIAMGRSADKVPALSAEVAVVAAWLACDSDQPGAAEDILVRLADVAEPAASVADALADQLMGPPTSQPDDAAAPAASGPPPAAAAPAPAAAAPAPAAAPPTPADRAMTLREWLGARGPLQGLPSQTPVIQLQSPAANP